MTSTKPLEIAIVGGGIIGLQLAIGLINRNQISATLYEQGTSLEGQGSGMAFTDSAMKCMRALCPDILEALQRVASPPSEAVYLTNQHPDCTKRRADGTGLSFDSAIRHKEGYNVLRALPRQQFINELRKLLPPSKLKLGMKLAGIGVLHNGRSLLTFADGSEVEVDAVIGCDGIKSKTRQIILDKDNPAAHPQDTHQREYRSHIPLEEAKEILGDSADALTIHMGPGGYVITYPFHNIEGSFVGVGAVIQDEVEWTKPHLKETVNKSPIVQHFSSWEPRIQKLIKAMPEMVDLWIIFDLTRCPLSSYAFGPVCLAGDAAHASAPFLGVGACMGIEDALALVTVLEHAATKRFYSEGALSARQIVIDALGAYDTIRRLPSQAGSKLSGQTIDTYAWRNPETRDDIGKISEDLEKRWNVMWSFDHQAMQHDIVDDFESRLAT